MKTQLQSEMFPPLGPGAPQRSWYELTSEERSKNLKARLKGYCQKVRAGGGAVSAGGVL